MLNFKSNITYYLSSTHTDMRKGREGLAGVVREKLQRDPYNYGDAFIFYSKDLRKVKILHYDINGFVIYENDYRPMIPCYYTLGKKQEIKAAIKQEQSELAHFAERKQTRPQVKVA